MHVATKHARRVLSNSPTPSWVGLWQAWVGAAGLGLLVSFGCANAEVRPNTETDAAAKDTAPDSPNPGDTYQKTDGQPPPDNKPEGLCDPFSNSGCTSSQKCTALQNGGNLELGCGSKGDKSEGDACTPQWTDSVQTGDDCGSALTCFMFNGEANAICRRLCPTAGNANACPKGSICSVGLPGMTDYASCGPSCKPLEQSGCAAAQACYLTPTGAVCKDEGSIAVGGDCPAKAPNECKRESTCVTGVRNGNKCLAFCSTSGGAPECPSGTTCTKIPVDDVFMSESNVGTCR
jgi:hypothetical protein